MAETIIRTVILVAITGAFIQQARRAGAGTLRQRAFALAAGGMGIFVLLNLLLLVGINVNPLLLPGSIIAVLLLAGSVVLLGMAWRKGEMHAQIEQLRDLLNDERQRK